MNKYLRMHVSIINSYYIWRNDRRELIDTSKELHSIIYFKMFNILTAYIRCLSAYFKMFKPAFGHYYKFYFLSWGFYVSMFTLQMDVCSDNDASSRSVYA